MPPLTAVIVDDATEYIQVVRLLLLRLPDLVTVVGEAANGEEALAVILRKRPDIVITDLVMPGLDGIGLTKHIRRELPQTIPFCKRRHGWKLKQEPVQPFLVRKAGRVFGVVFHKLDLIFVNKGVEAGGHAGE